MMKVLGNNFFLESSFKNRTAHDTLRVYLEEKLLKAQSLAGWYDIFLSHSSKDKTIVINFKKYLEINYRVYVDWIEDSEVGRDKITEHLKIAMNKSKVLLYLHTENSTKSKWIPWEIGFFDSLKGVDKIGIMPLLNISSQIPSYAGQEYLTVYAQVGVDQIDYFIKRD